MDAPTIATPRLRLRAHRADDLDALAALWSDPAVYRFIGGAARPREEVWLRLLRQIGQWRLLGRGMWVIEGRDTRLVAGEVGLFDARRAIDPAIDDAPEVGWILAPHAHGRGLAAEAVAAVLGWADAEGYDETVCIIDPAHDRSLALAARMGYGGQVIGRYRDNPIAILRRPRPGR